jgi:hypothetical protein
MTLEYYDIVTSKTLSDMRLKSYTRDNSSRCIPIRMNRSSQSDVEADRTRRTCRSHVRKSNNKAGLISYVKGLVNIRHVNKRYRDGYRTWRENHVICFRILIVTVIESQLDEHSETGETGEMTCATIRQ